MTSQVYSHEVPDMFAGPILRAVISGNTNGDNEIVAAVTGRKIRVMYYRLVVTTAVSVRFESAAGGTALTGQEPYAANGGCVNNYNPVGWFETIAGQALNMELSAGVLVAGNLGYILV